MAKRRWLAMLSLCAMAGTAVAQEPTKPEAPKPPAATADAAVLPVTLENALAKPEELPAGMKIVEGIRPVTPHAVSFHQDPTLGGRLPKPAKSGFQSLAAGDGMPGTVFLFEYEKAPPDSVKRLLGMLLWGRDNGPTAREPEEMVVQGRLLILLSFPRGDPGAEWFKERLRRRLRIPALRCRPDLDSLFRDLDAVYKASDADKGLRLLAENAEAVKGDSFAQFYVGEFGLMKKDWATAKRGYARALELDDSLEDPLPGSARYASLDGLGGAHINLRELPEAVAVLRRASAIAKGMKSDPRESSQADYNLACALALSDKHAEALEALKVAIARHPDWKESARKDVDFTESRKRQDFRELLGE